MRTLKPFIIEFDKDFDRPECHPILISVRKEFCSNFPAFCCKTEEEAFQWLENNGYITRKDEQDFESPLADILLDL